MPSLHHVALRVADCEISADFYRRAFGLEQRKRVERDGIVSAIWLRADACVLMLERSLRGSGGASGSGHVLAFSTNSLEDAEARLRDASIPIVDRTTFTLYVTDPDGHRAGVSAYRFDDGTP